MRILRKTGVRAGFGWREIGRWPQGLCLGRDDFRDEVLLCLPLVGQRILPQPIA